MTGAAASVPRLYAGRFFLVCAMHFLFMAGYSMLVHLPKHITALGGDVGTVASVFGLGMIGSLLSRPFIGRGIDWAGCRPVLLATTLGSAAIIATLALTNAIITVAALRIGVQLGQAAFLTTMAVIAARIAPDGRSAESLATMGAFGLAGIMVGPMLGDWIFAHAAGDRAFHLLFGVSAGMLALSGALAFRTSLPSALPLLAERRPPYWQLVRRHWPGPILLMGLALPLVQTMPMMFIERFAASRGIGGVTLFFVAYSPTAIVLRVAARTLPGRIGRRRTLLMGMTCYVVGLLLLVGVTHPAGLLVPALVMGAGHCFTYPFLVDLAAERMPREHRGAAISVILGTIDVGFLLSFVLQGQLIKYRGFSTALPITAGVAALLTVAYAWTERSVLGSETLRHATGEKVHESAGLAGDGVVRGDQPGPRPAPPTPCVDDR